MAKKKKSRKSAKATTKRKKSNQKRGVSQKKRSPKSSTKKKSIRKKAVAKRASKTAKKKGARDQDQTPFRTYQPSSRNTELAGDLQGLSHREAVDSESVGELLEEGNAFEAGVLSGVEDAGRQGTREVRTRQVPEDDVPAEYLDEE